MCVCPGPSFTLVCLSLLPCARYWCARQTAGQDRTRKDTHISLSFSTHAVRVTTHPCTSCPSISSSCPPPSSPLNEPQPDNSRSFPFPHLLLQFNSTPSPPAYIRHPVPCIDCSAARLHRPKPKPEPKPAPARHRKTHSETRSSESLPLPYIH